MKNVQPKNYTQARSWITDKTMEARKDKIINCGSYWGRIQSCAIQPDKKTCWWWYVGSKGKRGQN